MIRAGFLGTYLRRELRRRRRQAMLVAGGLAVGVGLVTTVTAAAAGVQAAQATVLHDLFGIGTDITVTTTPPPAPSPGSPQAGQFMLSPGATPQYIDALGTMPGLGLLDATAVRSVARLPGVAAAAGGLTLQDTRFTVPAVNQLGPDGQPPASATPTDFTVDGVDPAHPGLGPFGSARLTAGRGFAAADTDVAVVDAGYASANRLPVGSTITVAKTPFRVIGIVAQPGGGAAAEVYLPLQRAQALAQSALYGTFTGRVTTIYVAAAGADQVAAVRAEIATLLPTATVTSSGSLAGQASGSLHSAAELATALGRWLAIAALVAAFALAGLLTAAAVARRTRDFGTLKALGWRTRRITAQLLAESLVVGVLGAVLGVALGAAGVALLDALAPDLSATVAQNPGAALPQIAHVDSGGMHISVAPGATHTVTVHLTAQLSPPIIALAVALAVAGALLAGGVGAWRAARLRPAEALRRAR